jgi:hypothetical protein
MYRKTEPAVVEAPEEKSGDDFSNNQQPLDIC